MKELLSLLMLICFLISCEEKVVEHKTKEKPESNRFTKVVLTDQVDQPMQFDFLKDGRIVWVEREGKVKVFDPKNNMVQVLADIPSSVGYYKETGEVISPHGEDGMQGIAIDPNFEDNGWVYLFYSPFDGRATGTILSRVEWQADSLNMDTEIIMLEVPNQRLSCCHLGGGMVFDSHGDLYISTGDNTPNSSLGWNPIDERPGKKRFDAQKSSGNTNDLRGAILRIHPEEDGSYTIPKGNLFPEGTPKTRPEIYAMGTRNPWRLSIDSETGWLYWGEVGPDGVIDSVGRGPKSYEEFNRAKKAGNFGWPYFLADNKAFWEFDFETRTSGEQFNPERPINNSPNNTGLVELPSAEKAFVWYPLEPSYDFPIPGSGAGSAVGGPIFHEADYDNAENLFPAYYEGKWFVTDWARGWIMLITMDENGEYKSMEKFTDHIELNGPVDMKFGPDGSLYALEYGLHAYQASPTSVLSKIVYNGGNRKPIAELSSDKLAGVTPLTVQLSSQGSVDLDGDVLGFQWEVVQNGTVIMKSSESDFVAELNDIGVYDVILTVSDSNGATDKKSLQLSVGNAPPNVNFDLKGANSSFYFAGTNISYEVKVDDIEDGSLSNGDIEENKVDVQIDYVDDPDQFLSIRKKLDNPNTKERLNEIMAFDIMGQSDCKICHKKEERTLGPSFVEIANRYKDSAGAVEGIMSSIVNGSVDKWGGEVMPAHTTMPSLQVKQIADYILSLSEKAPNYGIKGKLEFSDAKVNSNKGLYVLRAFYTDQAVNGVDPLSTVKVLTLRNPDIKARTAEIRYLVEMDQNWTKNGYKESILFRKDSSYIAFKAIDLTDVNAIQFNYLSSNTNDTNAEGKFEVRLDSHNGELIGKSDNIYSSEHKNNSMVDDIDVKGVHDIYIVFRRATSDDKLYSELKEVSFQRK